MRKVVLYIATSLDGYIAKENHDISWLSVVGSANEDYGYGEFIKTVDTVIMGRRTYDKVLSMTEEFPHKGKKCYVLSRNRDGGDENITYYKGPVEELIEFIRREEGRNIFCDGGAEVVAEMISANVIDRYIISIVPVILGGGIKLFKEGLPDSILKLTRSTTFPSGLVQLWYERTQES